MTKPKPKPAKRKPNPSSTVSHQAAGRRSSLVWFDPADYDDVAAAAARSGQKVTQFIVHQVKLAAWRTLGKSQ